MDDKGYTLRELRADDLFVMIKIINKIGLKEVKECFQNDDVKTAIKDAGKNASDVENVGMAVMLDIAELVVSRLPDCRAEIYQFLASLSGLKAADIAALPLGTFVGMVKDVFTMPNFNDFFQRLTRSTN